ncbi:5'-nucleotidase C-terminal domain-containing protein [Halarchaeum sp. P4]|uniref:5'-nucleotidase C-terminal domain-containing protein n=1 Tax=Halarchaeum sp. P4 TaxID=3421639 RepID=UPI003EC07E07
MTATALVLLLTVSVVPLPATAAETTTDQTVPIEAIQTPAGDTGTSPYAGETVTTSGTVTLVVENGFYLQNGTGAYSGVFVYGVSNASVAPGDTVRVSAPVKEYNGLTELDAGAANANVTVTGSTTVPAATAVSTANASAEAYEGVRVAVANLTVTATPGQYGEWAVSDGSGTLAVDNVAAEGANATPAETGATIASMTGVVHYDYGAFKVRPTAMAPIESSGGSAGSGDGGGGENATTLTVVSYNDVQTAMSDPNATGRLVAALNERRAAHDNPTVVVGGGDEVSPSSLAPVSNWTVPTKVLNKIDPAAEVIGNHDLDYGFDAVSNFSAASEFPWLLANVRGEDGGNVPGTKNYTIVERGNVSVGIVGLVDEQVKPTTAVDFAANGYRVADYRDVGARIATKLKEEKNVDVVIAAAHMGVAPSKTLAKSTEHIDVVVTGHDEVIYEPQSTSGAVVMEAGSNADAIAEANLTVSDAGVSFDDGRVRTIDDSAPVNGSVRSLVADARGDYLSTVAGVTRVPLDSTSASNYHDETAWGNFIADAFRANQGSDVAVTNAGGIRGNFVIPPGNVTYDDVYTSLPFGNTLVTKQLNGTELKYLLASQVEDSPQYGLEPKLQVSGVTYEMNARTSGIPVTDVYVNGEPLDPDATYTVTVNSYMAGWEKLEGQPYSVGLASQPTVKDTRTLYGTATVEYLDAQSPIAPNDTDRIRRVSHDAGNATLEVSGDTVTATVDVPANATGVNASSFVAQNETTGVLAATDVAYDADAGTVTVTFEREAYATLAASSDTLQLYGTYDTDAIAFEYFEQAVLNANLGTDLPGSSEETPAPEAAVGLALGDGGTLDAPLGDTARVPVRVSNASGGVGAYELNVSVGASGVARITGVDTRGADLSEVTIGPDNRSAHIEVALAGVEAANATLATVELSGVALDDSTTLKLTPQAGPYDVNGSAYAVTSVENARVTVTAGDLTGNGLAMADPDGDGRYQDVNGDGSADVVDAQALFAARDDAAVQASAPAFDFNGDDRVTVGDVQALFAGAEA